MLCELLSDIFPGDFLLFFGLWLRFLVFAAHFPREFSPKFWLTPEVLSFLPSAIIDIDFRMLEND
jgi:hypothetical protein